VHIEDGAHIFRRLKGIILYVTSFLLNCVTSKLIPIKITKLSLILICITNCTTN